LRIYFDLGKAVTVGRKEKKQHYSTIEFHTLETLLYTAEREREIRGREGGKRAKFLNCCCCHKTRIGGKKVHCLRHAPSGHTPLLSEDDWKVILFFSLRVSATCQVIIIRGIILCNALVHNNFFLSCQCHFPPLSDSNNHFIE